MHFANPTLQRTTAVLRAAPGKIDRACGDNLAFEDRVAAPRQAAFEAIAGTRPDIQTGHNEYIKASVVLKDRAAIPSTFSADNTDAILGVPADQPLVRTEDLTGFATSYYHDSGGPAALLALFRRYRAGDTGTAPALRGFVDAWNAYRDVRPMFAAFLDEVRLAADASDWAVRLRAQLGLAHIQGYPAAPVFLAQMRYAVADVRAATPSAAHASFAAPTVLDGGLSPYFFPSPKPPPGIGGSCGRTVHLEDRPPLVAEVLNISIPYRLEHLHDLVSFTTPLPASAGAANLPALRNGHLGRLRVGLGCPGFAALMPV